MRVESSEQVPVWDYQEHPGVLPQRLQLQWDQAPQDQPELEDPRRGDNEAPLATRVTGKPPA